MVAREERDFVALTKREADIAEERFTFVVDLGQSVDVKDLVTAVALSGEDDAGILAVGRLDIVDHQLLQQFLTAGRLT